MIDADKRNAAFLLHQEGMSAREIARRLGLGRNTLHRMLALSGAMPSAKQREKQPLDAELLQRLYTQCDGWIQRVQEKLAEEEGVRVAYQTLTRKLRALASARHVMRAASVCLMRRAWRCSTTPAPMRLNWAANRCV